jgi:peptidoglycan/xylan/chitin deacetylase (PgdA/CDA1 family)
MRNQVIVTTSWDDGHKLDLRLAKLLKKYNIKGTFYVSPRNREFKQADLLIDKEIIELSKDFEIGAHTMTHPRLTKVSEEEAKKEIIDSKKYLENLTKKEIKSFCYPGGDYNKKIKELVKKAGFSYARTINPLIIKYPRDLFEIGVTISSSPPSIMGLFGETKFVIKYNMNLLLCLFTKDWEKRARIAFDSVLKRGGVYHLWGHSWVINKDNNWDKLERVLAYISNKQNVKYLINSQLKEMYE